MRVCLGGREIKKDEPSVVICLLPQVCGSLWFPMHLLILIAHIKTMHSSVQRSQLNKKQMGIQQWMKANKKQLSQITKIEFMCVTAAYFTIFFYLLFRQWKHLSVDNTEYKSFTFIYRSLFLYINNSLNAKLMTIKYRESLYFLSLYFSAFNFIFYKL